MSFAYSTTQRVQTGQVTGTLNGFPLLVSYTDARFASPGNGGVMQSGSAYDIGFYIEGVRQAHECERHDLTTGEIIYWVYAPSIYDGQAVEIRFGDATVVASLANATAVWDSNFKGVYHFSDGTTLSLADATGLTTGTNHNMVANDGGQIDGCTSTGSGGGYADYGSAHNFTSEAFTISSWVYLSYLDNGAGQGPVIFYKGRYQVSGYYSQVDTNGSFKLATNQSGAVQGSASSASLLTTGIFYYLTVIRNGSSVVLLKNGVDVTSTSGSHTNPDSSSDTFQFNSYNDGGIIGGAAYDEMRVSNTNRSVSWELASYNNQFAPSTFLGTLAGLATFHGGSPLNAEFSSLRKIRAGGMGCSLPLEGYGL